ncbi:MAG: hypothetical protein V4555_19315 [Acidobacteriota bacterium]
MLLVVLLFVSPSFRTEIRWLIVGFTYRNRALAAPAASGELHHTEWNSSGLAGNETIVYLVNDPDDKLAEYSAKSGPTRSTSLPCEVPDITRLRRSWYLVTFYTQSSWDDCEGAPATNLGSMSTAPHL